MPLPVEERLNNRRDLVFGDNEKEEANLDLRPANKRSFGGGGGDVGTEERFLCELLERSRRSSCLLFNVPVLLFRFGRGATPPVPFTPPVLLLRFGRNIVFY